MAKGRSDLELVTAARAGDSAAFGRLFDRWFDRVGDVAWRIVRNRDTAAEVARTTFEAAWQQRSELGSSDEFGPWLLRLARRRALDRLEHDRRPGAGADEGGLASRRPGARGASSSGPAASAASSSSSSSSGEGDGDGDGGGDGDDQIVWAAFAALGERDASLLDLHLRHGVAPEVLADDLGVAPGEAGLAMEQKCSLLAVGLRSWGLWSAAPSDRCPRLAEALTAGGASHFGEAVRTISSHAAGCPVCSEAQQALPEPEGRFAAVPVATAPVAMRAQAASGLQAAGIEVGTAFSRSKPTGEVAKVDAAAPAEEPAPAAPPAPPRSETVARPTVAERLAARGARVGGAAIPTVVETPRDDFVGAGSYRSAVPIGSGAGDATAASPAPDPAPSRSSRPSSEKRNRRLALAAAAVALVVGVTGVALAAGGSSEDDDRVESGERRSDDSGFVSESDADDGDTPSGTAPDGPAADERHDGAATSMPGSPGGTLPGGETVPPGSGGVGGGGGLIPGDPTGTTVPGGSDDPGVPPGTAPTTTTRPDNSPGETTTTTPTTPPPAGPPSITSYRATSTGNCGLLNLNKSMVFTWRSTGADSATFGQRGGTKAAVDPNGSATACAPIGTTYQLTVTGPGGTDSASSTVTL